jgi:hypothetical protein
MAGAKIERICCWICGRDVSLRDCKLDEPGHPVHEECYVARTKLEAESADPPAKRQVV